MNREALYHKTVDILYQAYFNDTLEHGQCTSFAIGNIVAANCGFNFEHTVHGLLWFSASGRHEIAFWDYVFSTVNNHQAIYPDKAEEIHIKKQIDSTGYPWQELAQIEFAFETAPAGLSKADRMFNGLVAVLEVLKQLHEVVDISADIHRFETHRLTRTLV